jgi:hypothetical protein
MDENLFKECTDRLTDKVTEQQTTYINGLFTS